MQMRALIGIFLVATLLNTARSVGLCLSDPDEYEDLMFAQTSKEQKEKCDIPYNAPLFKLLDGKLLKGRGYNYAKYKVTTQDGYILQMIRVLKKDETEKSKIDRPPVLFQHGLTMTCENFLTSDGGHPIVLQALDAGWDVWLGNNRGNRYS